jgi:hypothetical protein
MAAQRIIPFGLWQIVWFTPVYETGEFSVQAVQGRKTFSVGYVVGETAEAVTLAPSLGKLGNGFEVASRIVIPVGSIAHRKRLVTANVVHEGGE